MFTWLVRFVTYIWNCATEAFLYIWTGTKDIVLWWWNLEVEVTLPRFLVEFFTPSKWESWTPVVFAFIILIVLYIWG